MAEKRSTEQIIGRDGVVQTISVELDEDLYETRCVFCRKMPCICPRGKRVQAHRDAMIAAKRMLPPIDEVLKEAEDLRLAREQATPTVVIDAGLLQDLRSLHSLADDSEDEPTVVDPRGRFTP